MAALSALYLCPLAGACEAVGYKELLREIDHLAEALDSKHTAAADRYERLAREADTLQAHLESLEQVQARLCAADRVGVHVA